MVAANLAPGYGCAEGRMPATSEQSAERLHRRGARLAMAFVAIVAVGLGVGAWQLARAQSHDRGDLRARYASRAPVASALVDALFQLAFQQQRQQAAQRFAGALTPTQMAAYARRNQQAYAAILDSSGRRLAASPGAPPTVGRAVLVPALRRGLAVSDVLAVGGRQVIESAVSFPARSGLRVFVGGSPIGPFRQFLAGSLRPLAQYDGSRAYVLDGHGTAIAGVAGARLAPPPGRQLVAASARRRSGFYSLGGEGRFFAVAPQPDTAWRIVVSVPTSVLYRPASGVSRWLPWVILGLLGVALLAVAALVRRAIAASAEVARVNHQLALSQERLREHADELQRANVELQRSNAELEQFAYVASHDLSAPLRAVAGFSQLLQARYRGKLDGDADGFIDHMQSGVDRMQRIIDDLLAYSRVERTRLEAADVDLDAVLEEILGVLAPQIAERGATVTHDPLPTVCGDAGQLGQVLQNLVANAMKFTAPGVAPEVHVSATRSGEGWRVAVRDNGIGVDPAQAERIFKMFQRLHGVDEYPGTGIGLAIVAKIVERHGGTTSVEPAPGGGSVFAFEVPAATPAGSTEPAAVA
jgi:signal transduction histidine kinase